MLRIVNYPQSFEIVSIKVNGISRTNNIREITDDNKKERVDSSYILGELQMQH